jgi:bifunctional non-homologous end joining protein LigD
MPVSWDGLGKLTSADRFTLAKARKRAAALKQHPWGEFRSLGQQLPTPILTNLTAQLTW